MAVGTSSALASAGAKYRGTGSDAGSRAKISGSATVPSQNGTIATVRTQGISDGLFQFGHIKQGNNFTTNCGGPGTIGYMAERQKVGGNYLCNVYFGSFGSSHVFSVKPNASFTGWSAYLDGAFYEGPWGLGYQAGQAFAVGEYDGFPPTSYSMQFGSGTPWQYTVNGTSWITINSATNYNDGGWIITSLPSPFTISR